MTGHVQNFFVPRGRRAGEFGIVSSAMARTLLRKVDYQRVDCLRISLQRGDIKQEREGHLVLLCFGIPSSYQHQHACLL